MGDVLEPGEVAERYIVHQKLGSGGMSEVYLVKHRTLGTLHALKVLTLTGPSLQHRLVEEGKIQATLNHPNLVKVSDVLTVKGLPALVMEYVDGPDLGQWISIVHPDAAAAEQLFRQIVAGVGAAHEAGVVHRDLKPGNVFVATGPNGTLIPKVGDFGLMKAATPASGGHTRVGQPMGTPQYMPPEQIRDATTVDQRADVWSLGCVLYELLAHEIAFPGHDLLEIFTKVSDGTRKPLPPTVPQRLAAIVDWCLELDPADRPADCLTLLLALDGHLPASRMPAPPTPPPATPTPWSLSTSIAAASPMTVIAFAGSMVTLLVLTIAVVGFVALRGDGLPGVSAQDVPRCPETGGRLGWVPVPPVFEKPIGSVWTLRVRTPVYESIRAAEAGEPATCALPIGAQVTVRPGRAQADSSDYLPVDSVGIDQHPAAGVEEPDGEVAGERCRAADGASIGWFWIKYRYNNPLRPNRPTNKPRDNVRLDYARYLYADYPHDDAPKGSVVCALPKGATVDLRGRRVEIPVSNGEWIEVVGGAIR